MLQYTTNYGDLFGVFGVLGVLGRRLLWPLLSQWLSLVQKVFCPKVFLANLVLLLITSSQVQTIVSAFFEIFHLVQKVFNQKPQKPQKPQKYTEEIQIEVLSVLSLACLSAPRGNLRDIE